LPIMPRFHPIIISKVLKDERRKFMLIRILLLFFK